MLIPARRSGSQESFTRRSSLVFSSTRASDYQPDNVALQTLPTILGRRSKGKV
jgi:hypothetical protein